MQSSSSKEKRDRERLVKMQFLFLLLYDNLSAIEDMNLADATHIQKLVKIDVKVKKERPNKRFEN